MSVNFWCVCVCMHVGVGVDINYRVNNYCAYLRILHWGFANQGHRARIPAVHVTASTPMCKSTEFSTSTFPHEQPQGIRVSSGVGSALDVRNAAFLERRQVDTGICTAFVDERWYAHATRPSLLIHEITVINRGTADVNFSLLASVTAPSTDLNLQQVSTSIPNTYAVTGDNICAEDATAPNGGNHTKVSMVASLPCAFPVGGSTCFVTETVQAGTTQTYTFVMSVATSLNHSDTLIAATAALNAAVSVVANTCNTYFKSLISFCCAMFVILFVIVFVSIICNRISQCMSIYEFLNARIKVSLFRYW